MGLLYFAIYFGCLLHSNSERYCFLRVSQRFQVTVDTHISSVALRREYLTCLRFLPPPPPPPPLSISRSAFGPAKQVRNRPRMPQTDLLVLRPSISSRARDRLIDRESIMASIVASKTASMVALNMASAVEWRTVNTVDSIGMEHGKYGREILTKKL